MENLILSFNVIAPLFFLMVIGYVLVHHTKLADKELCSKANALVFKVFLPCMLFKNIYQSDIRTLMVIGYVLVHHTKLADKELCSKANALVFKVFLPCMLFKNIYQSDIRTQIDTELCLFAAGSLLLLFVLLCFLVPKVVKKENQQGVVIQGIFRSNYVIFGVAVVENMYGSV